MEEAAPKKEVDPDKVNPPCPTMDVDDMKTYFKHRKAYIVALAEAENLEEIPEIENDIEDAKNGLKEWGFEEKDIRVSEDQYDLPYFQDQEYYWVKQKS